MVANWLRSKYEHERGGACADLQEVDRKEVLICRGIHQVLHDRSKDALIRISRIFSVRHVNKYWFELNVFEDAAAIA